MTPPKTSPQSVDALEERLNGIETITREGFKRLEDLIQSIEARLRAIETSATTKLAVVETRLDAAWDKIDDHEVAVKEFRHEAEQIKILKGLLGWILSAFGILVISLLWAIFTHQIEIVQVISK